MSRLIECVPNVSEGKDQSIIAELSRAAASVGGVRLLDVDPGAETNRTVFTFVGPPEAVGEAAFRFISRAAELIDMRRHQGAHPRIGATDVCPFVPVSGVSMEECAALARALGERVGRELSIPVYLYEAASSRPERKNLADIRKGEYEGLGAKLADPAWKPDFGPEDFGERQQRSGATVIGARPFLIAYNVNLNTKDKKLANEIAFTIRESGRAKTNVPGTLKAVKATGWVIEQYGCAQVSINVIDHRITSLAQVFDECVRVADTLGVRVTGSELVGLIPKEALLEAGRHFLAKMRKPTFAPEAELLRTAVRSLGLSELGPFEAQKKIIEHQLAAPAPLAALSVGGFVDELSADSPAPGGGSVAALIGACGAALTAMVASLSVQKKAAVPASVTPSALSDAGSRAQVLKAELVRAIDTDTLAFNQVLAAMRLPRVTPEQAAARERALELANQGATTVPLEVMRAAAAVAGLAETACTLGMEASVSDAAVGALAALAALEGAYLNVRINLKSVSDAAFKEQALREAERLAGEARMACERARAAAEKLLG